MGVKADSSRRKYTLLFSHWQRASKQHCKVHFRQSQKKLLFSFILKDCRLSITTLLQRHAWMMVHLVVFRNLHLVQYKKIIFVSINYEIVIYFNFDSLISYSYGQRNFNIFYYSILFCRVFGWMTHSNSLE